MLNVSFKRFRLPQRPWGVPWGPLLAIAVVILIFFLTMKATDGLLDLVFIHILPSLPFSFDLNFNQHTLVHYGVSAGFSLLLISWFLNWRGTTWKALGFSKWLSWKQFLWPIIGFAGYIALSLALSNLVSVLLPSLNLDQIQDIGFVHTFSILEMIGMFAVLVVITPLIEESIFRGILFGGLRTRLPIWLAAGISSLAFGLAHFQPNIIIDTFALGVVCSLLYERTRSLWPSIFLHGLKNAVAFALIFVFQIN